LPGIVVLGLSGSAVLAVAGDHLHVAGRDDARHARARLVQGDIHAIGGQRRTLELGHDQAHEDHESPGPVHFHPVRLDHDRQTARSRVGPVEPTPGRRLGGHGARTGTGLERRLQRGADVLLERGHALEHPRAAVLPVGSELGDGFAGGGNGYPDVEHDLGAAHDERGRAEQLHDGSELAHRDEQGSVRWRGPGGGQGSNVGRGQLDRRTTVDAPEDLRASEAARRGEKALDSTLSGSLAERDVLLVGSPPEAPEHEGGDLLARGLTQTRHRGAPAGLEPRGRAPGQNQHNDAE
jgi:hypothetical protein